MGFWLQLGASGFRIDAAPFVLEQIEPGVDPGPQDFSILDSWRQDAQWQVGDSVLLCEANVPPSEVPVYAGASRRPRRPGPDDVRLPAQPSALAGAGPAGGGTARRGVDAAVRLPDGPVGDVPAQPRRTRPEPADLGAARRSLRHSPRARTCGCTAGGSAAGWRRCWAATGAGSSSRTRCSSPARHAGDPLRRRDRDGREPLAGRAGRRSGPRCSGTTARTPGSRRRRRETLSRPVPARGGSAPERQRARPAARPRLPAAMVREPRAHPAEGPEIGTGSTCSIVDVPRAVLAHRFDAPSGSILLLHNLGAEPVTVDIGRQAGRRRPRTTCSSTARTTRRP